MSDIAAEHTPDPHHTQPERRPLAKIIFRNTLVLTGSEWLVRMFNLAYSIIAVRLLGEHGYGSYATVIAFVGTFGVFFELGMTQYVERSIAQRRERSEELFADLVALRLIMATFGVALVTALAGLSGYDTPLILGVFLSTSSFWLAALLAPMTSVLAANERFDLTAGIDLAGRVLMIGGGLALLLLTHNFLAMIVVGLLVMPVQIVLSALSIRRHRLGRLMLRPNPRNWWGIVMASLPFGLTSLALTFNFSIDSVIMSINRSVEEVGWYSVAYGLVFSLGSIARGFWRSLTPSLAREHTSSPELVHVWTRASIQVLALCALPLAVGGSLLAGPIIALLYGPAYAPSAPILTIIIWDLPLVMFTSFSGNITAAANLERPASYIYLFCAGLNLLLNLILIPRFGMLAAACVTVASDGLSALLFGWLLHQRMNLSSTRSSLMRVALAAALMGLVVWQIRQWPLFAGIAIGGLVYGLLALWLRLIQPSLIMAYANKLLRR